MYKNIDDKTRIALIEYVVDQQVDENSTNIIRRFCRSQDPITTTVYRGHAKSQTIRPSIWYSASKNIDVAENGFAGKDCCVFIIHLINIPCIDINHYIGNQIRSKNTEEEIIVLGGGTFYENKDLTVEGFKPLDIRNGKKNFETWYSFDSKIPNEASQASQAAESTHDKLTRLSKIIDEDEHELIKVPNDIFIPGYDLTEDEKEKIFKIIKKSGGKRRKTKRRKCKRKKTKRR